MHVLTKIFIVIVSLLAVAIVPLVAVNARNEASFKGQLEEAKTRAAAAQSALAASEASRQAAEANWNAQLQAELGKVSTIERELRGRMTEITRLEGELAAAKSLQASINSSLEILSQTGKANNELMTGLVRDVADWRSRALAAETRQVELEEALANKASEAEVLLAQVRMLQEQNQSLQEARAAAEDTIQKYLAFAGELPAARAGLTGDGESLRLPADRDLACSVTGVSQAGDSKIAEINAGSRDGIRAGWVLTVADQGRFIANLRITEVDVNRSIGIIELEDSGRGSVAEGQKAIARRGE